MDTNMQLDLTVDLAQLDGPPTYRGSVQDLYRLTIDDRPYFIAKTSDAGSVFDVGTFFAVPGSGRARTAMRHYIYTALAAPDTWKSLTDADIQACFADSERALQLSSSGMLASLRAHGARTHHVGVVDPTSGQVHSEVTELDTTLTLVEEYPVIRPNRFAYLNKPAWDYHHYQLATNKLMAVEHVFRRGCPGGSSLLQRYAAAAEAGDTAAADFLTANSLTEPPQPWTLFPNMTYDCATKFEDHDRHLPWQETVHLSGVSADVFQRVIELLTYCTIALNRLLSMTALTLWDVKWELAVADDELVVVDTIDQDSIRLTGTQDVDGRCVYFHFNKQAVRDYYRIVRADWYAALNDAKAVAAVDPQGRVFREVYDEGVSTGAYPPIPTMDPKFAALQEQKYQLPLQPFVAPGVDAAPTGEGLMQDELRYYSDVGFLDGFLDANSARAQ
jgi:phosphoribosylaminoimidazole-succinocarboxamide synthase